ncbi:DEAD/DEAH box helicase [Cellulomonas sp.]|uniref:DEAD/DEAH box helicase n=1 Tax=Cellulomonas sp. TaxID=40001 RepID=UPI003BA9A81F
MSTQNDALHTALIARPQQTARELALGLAVAGHTGLTEAEVEQVLERDPRLRSDGSTPPRWRALGAGHPATQLHLPTPHHPAPHVLAPATSFGPRTAPGVAEQPVTPSGILPAAAFGRRPSVRLRQDTEPAQTVAAAPPAADAPTIPVRVPVIARLAAIDPPTIAVPVPRPETSPLPPLPSRPTAVEVPATITAPKVPTTRPVPQIPAPPAPPHVETVAPAAPVEVVASVEVAAPVETTAPIEAPAPVEVLVTPPRAPTVSALFRTHAAPATADRSPLPPGGDVRYVGPQLRRWQKDVLDAWLAAGRRGIVESVSAQGRDVVGVLATWDALTRGEKVLVLVPTTDLLEQWLTTLTVQLPGLSVGRRDLTTAHTFDDCDVLVSLVSSAFGHDLLEDRAGLLVADEVHRYGSARPAETLRDGFGARLGLTPSIERQDAGVDEVLRPYFGTVLDGCDLRRGRAEGVLARFRLAVVPVDLGPAGQAEYDALSAQITELQERLAAHGCAPATFLDDAIRLQGGWRENARAAADASGWLRAMSSRRDLLATSAAKIDAVALLGPVLARSARGLVFTHAKDDADTAATRLRSVGVVTSWFHNGQEPEARRNTQRDLRRGRVTVLSAPKALDEGLDLPTIDAVVILSSSRSRRQLVQRVGPVLRPTQTDRLPLVVVVHARGTVDEDDGFLAELVEVATEVRTFDRDAAEITDWFVGA